MLQLSCLGLIGALAAAGCGGSDTPVTHDGSVGGSDGSITPFAALTPDKSVVTIGTVDLGKSGTTSVIITNTGTAASGTPVVAPGAGITTTGCTAALAPKATCTLAITATPPVLGAFNGSVSISANPGAVTPILISVTGTAVAPGQFSVTPTSIPLGNVALNTPSKQVVTVTALVDLTDLAASLNGADLTKDASSTCTASLTKGATCTVVVNFTATSSGSKNDSIVISAGGANGKIVTVQITADALAPAKLVTAPNTQQTFATTVNKPSSAITFYVSNSGDVATGAINVAFTGANKDDFAATTTCTLLAPLPDSCTVSVVFTPKAVNANETAALTVTDSTAGGSSATVALVGVSVAETKLVITPDTSDLGTVLVGQTGTATTFTVTNTGDTASAPLSASVSDTQFVLNTTCNGATLAKNATCTVAVALKPASVGVKSATLNVGGAVKTLTGTGISGPGLSVTPNSWDFATVRLNNTGTAQTFTVKNTGGAATGALTFTKSGDFSLFPITANTCSAALAPTTTCTFTVNFAPVDNGLATDIGSKTAGYTVTDGAASASVAVSGVAGAPTGITVTPGTVTSCARPSNTGSLAAAGTCFTDTVVGSTSPSQVTFVVKADHQLPAGMTDTGAITPKFVGANLADFAIVTNGCATALLADAQCQIVVSFTPSAVGLRQAGLSLTTTNGGSASSSFQVNGLPVIEIVAGDLVTTPPTTLVTAPTAAQLDFGSVTNLSAAAATSKSYTVIVRGPIAAAAPFPTNTITATLTNTGTPSDFNYLPVGTTENPCTGTVLTPTTPSASGTHAAAWHALASEYGIMCTFQVQFYPQTGKGPKTATIAATGSAAGTASQTLTGLSSGPLTINPATDTFVDTQVGHSTNETPSLNREFVVKNNGQTSQGPLAIALGGTDVSQFHVVFEDCSLQHTGTATSGILAQNEFCTIRVAFSPTSVGAKTGTLTVTTAGAAETATATFTANGTQTVTITATPTPLDFGPVVQTQASTLQTITVSNPAGAPTTSQITYALAGDHAGAFKLAAAGAQGTCGSSGTVSLSAGQSCTILVQFTPGANDPVGAINDTGEVTNLHVDAGIGGAKDVSLIGTVSTALTVSPATLDFGNVAIGSNSVVKTLTVSNLGSAAVTPVFANVSPFSAATGTTCNVAVNPGSSCVINLQMGGTGTAGTAVSATYPITSAAAVAKATLTGTPVNNAALVAVGVAQTGNTIDLGGVRIGSTSGPVVLTYKNTGGLPTTPVQFQWATTAAGTADSEFLLGTETGTCVGSLVQPGSTCTVTVTFKPSALVAVGPRTAKLFTIAADAGGAVAAYSFTATSLSQSNSAYFSTAGGSILGFATFAGKTPVAGTTTLELQFNNGTPAALTGVTFGVASTFGTEFSTIDLTDGGATTKCAASGTTFDLASGASCTFLVSFKPVAAYDPATIVRWASITASTTAALPGTAGILGLVQSPASLKVTPAPVAPATSVNLGDVLLNSTKAQAFVVTNTGETATKTLAVTSDSAAYTVDTGCNVILAAGQACTVNATLHTGGTLGAIAGNITVSDIVATGTTSATIAVTAKGVITSVLSLPVGPLDFGSVVVGNTGTAQTITVTNVANGQTTGPVAVALDDATNFTIVSNGCFDLVNNVALTLVGGDTCSVVVNYKPTTVPATAVTTAHLTATGTPGGTASVTLTGTATSTLKFNVTTAAPTVAGDTFTVSRLSTSAPRTALLGAAAIGGTDAALFAVVSDGCYGSTIAGSESCSVTVQYIGGTVTGAKTATLTVSDGTSANTATMALTH
jgi:hypothetical protein